MSAALPEYELYAIRYATREARRAEHFIGGDPHDAPMPMDYFVWVATSPERTFAIDCGFTADVAARRKRVHLRDPADCLRLVGVDPDTVEDLIVTHMHYDHIGALDRFPKARFHLQDAEMAFATGRHMAHKEFSRGFEADDVCEMVRLNFAQRVVFHDGPAELAPGIAIHPVGGHTAGMQFVKVHTRRGWVVLASDVSHYYENLESRRPFTLAFHVGQMLEAFDTLLAHAPTPGHIVPGHDPLVMKRYPAPSPELEGVVVRLDVPPAGDA